MLDGQQRSLKLGSTGVKYTAFHFNGTDLKILDPIGCAKYDLTYDKCYAAVEEEMSKAKSGKPTVFVATAAVADWRPAKCAARKLKKGQMSDTLKLVRNPDILKTVACRTKHQAPARIARASTIFVGFAAETNDVIAEARRKCREKNLDMIVANDVTEKGSGFGVDTNRVTFVRKDGSVDRLPLMTKLAVARRIVRECEDLCP